jgi:uncharacterized protein
MPADSSPTFPPLPPPQPQLDSRVSLAIRIGFYVVIGTVLYIFIPGLLFVGFGTVISATIGLFAVAYLTNVMTMRIFDRRPLSDIGLGAGHGTGRNFVIGLLCGGGAAALMLTAPLLAGAAHFIPRGGVDSSPWSSDVFFLLALLFGAAGEEALFRGYAFQLAIEKIGPFATILPVAVLFGFGHAANPHSTYLSVLNTALWGVLLGYAFVRSRDLWLPIGMHYSWNAVLPLFGVNLSGLRIDITRYTYQWDLGSLWSGGDYGPEGGLLTTVFAVSLFFVLHRAPIVPQRAMIAEKLNDFEDPLS